MSRWALSGTKTVYVAGIRLVEVLLVKASVILPAMVVLVLASVLLV